MLRYSDYHESTVPWSDMSKHVNYGGHAHSKMASSFEQRLHETVVYEKDFRNIKHKFFVKINVLINKISSCIFFGEKLQKQFKVEWLK